MTRTVERNRLKERRRLAIKMRRAAETHNVAKWDRLVREATRLGYLTEAQAVDLASQKEYLGAHMPTQQALANAGRGGPNHFDQPARS